MQWMVSIKNKITIIYFKKNVHDLLFHRRVNNKMKVGHTPINKNIVLQMSSHLQTIQKKNANLEHLTVSNAMRSFQSPKTRSNRIYLTIHFNVYVCN